LSRTVTRRSFLGALGALLVAPLAVFHATKEKTWIYFRSLGATSEREAFKSIPIGGVWYDEFGPEDMIRLRAKQLRRDAFSPTRLEGLLEALDGGPLTIHK